MLEVGTGIGTVAETLLAVADRVVGIEPNANCIARLPEAIRQDSWFVLWDRPLAARSHESLQAERFDAVVCINMLEHVADDVGRSPPGVAADI